MNIPSIDNLDAQYFMARKVVAFYEILDKETGEVVQTTVALPLPRKRFGKPIRSKLEALSALMGQENEKLTAIYRGV